MWTCQRRPRQREVRALLFSTSVVGSFTPPSNWHVGWRRLGQRLNVTVQWRDHLNWSEQGVKHSQYDLNSYFKTLVCDRDLPLCSLPTELTRWWLPTLCVCLTAVRLSLSGKKSSSGGRQRRTGGFVNQTGSIDISDRMFLGGRVQSNLPTVQEEDNEGSRQSVSSTDSSFSQMLSGGQEGSSLEAEATHQLVTLVMDFLSYPGANKGVENSSFVKTESYEVVQMSHYLGVLMGYDIKVGEFTGNPRRLRYGCPCSPLPPLTFYLP